MLSYMMIDEHIHMEPSTKQFVVYFAVHTVNPSDSTDLTECYNDDVESARIPVEQRHHVHSSLHYVHT